MTQAGSLWHKIVLRNVFCGNDQEDALILILVPF